MYSVWILRRLDFDGPSSSIGTVQVRKEIPEYPVTDAASARDLRSWGRAGTVPIDIKRVLTAVSKHSLPRLGHDPAVGELGNKAEGSLGACFFSDRVFL